MSTCNNKGGHLLSIRLFFFFSGVGQGVEIEEEQNGEQERSKCTKRPCVARYQNVPRYHWYHFKNSPKNYIVIGEKKKSCTVSKNSRATEEMWNTFLSTSTPSYPIYSSLFSSVTKIFEPPDFSSCEVTFPKSSISTQKYISKLHSSMLLSLKEKKKCNYFYINKKIHKTSHTRK